MTELHPSLPDVPYAQLAYRSALLSTEFATDRHARARRPRRRRWAARALPVRRSR